MFCTFLISKPNFLLVICMAKNFIWTTLKAIFAPSDSKYVNSIISSKYCPILINHTSMESSLTLIYDWFCDPGSYMALSKSTLSDLSTLQVHSRIHRGTVVYAQLFSVRDWFVSEGTGLLFCARGLRRIQPA